MNKSIFAFIIFLSFMAGINRPENHSVLSYIHILFEWDKVENAPGYDFQLSNSDNFSTTITNIPLTDLYYLETENITWNTKYYWRVRSQSVDDWNNITIYNFSIGSPLSNVNVIMHNPTEYADGYTIFGSGDGFYSAIIDKNGKEIWNSGNDSIIYYNFSDDGQFFGARYSPDSTYQYIGIEFSLTEGIKWSEPNDEFSHHEFFELPWGDYMGIAHEYQDGPVYSNPFDIFYATYGCPPDGITPCWPWQGDRLVIWDKDTKEIKWTWSTFGHFDMSDHDNSKWDAEPNPPPNGYFDWTHVNAFTFETGDNCIPQDSCIYISTRNLSRISKIDYPSGNIIWNMGHEYPSGNVHFGHELDFSQQHSISLTDEGNFLILDNGNYATEYWGAPTSTTRALEISVSDDQSSAAIEWEYVLDTDLFGEVAGNVQQLKNGNYLITTRGHNGTSLEFSLNEGIIWEAHYSSEAIWRASRIPNSLFEDIKFNGCRDISACNFNNLGSDGCWYISDGCSCNDGENVVSDECGTCDSDPSNDCVEDCAGIWGGNTEVDECGTCGGMGPTLECSCEAIPEGACDCNGNVLDECGICGGAGIPDGACNCEGNEPEEYYNCEGNCIISGDADLDGVCDGQLAISNNLTPYNYSIQNIYPNPFNPVTHITYGLPEYTNVQIMVFDLTGKQIQSLISEFQSPGYHSIIWNAGSHPSGMYILRMQIDNKLNPKKNILSKKIMLLK